MKILIIVHLLAIWISNTPFLIIQHNHGNKIAPLMYISRNPIKAEDGVSYFSDKPDSLAKKRFILSINFHHTACIQIGHYKFIYFEGKKRMTDANGYTDVYRGKTGELKLMITSIEKGTNYTSRRNGVLSLHIGKIVKQLHVYGNVQDNDKINRRLFGY